MLLIGENVAYLVSKNKIAQQTIKIKKIPRADVLKVRDLKESLWINAHIKIKRYYGNKMAGHPIMADHPSIFRSLSTLTFEPICTKS